MNPFLSAGSELLKLFSNYAPVLSGTRSEHLAERKHSSAVLQGYIFPQRSLRLLQDIAGEKN